MKIFGVSFLEGSQHDEADIGEWDIDNRLVVEELEKTLKLEGIPDIPDLEANHQALAHSENSSTTDSTKHYLAHRKFTFTSLMMLVGAAASAAFMTLGINSAIHEQETQFYTATKEFSKAIDAAWHEYEVYGLWIHESCRPKRENIAEPTHNASNLGLW